MSFRLSAGLLLLVAGTASAGTFPDVGYVPPSGWTGPKFELSQDYPAQLPPAETLPWATIDFAAQPKEYMTAVIDYCYDESLANEFVVQQNAGRKWYHAPWLHWGGNGREFVRGLTRERASRKFELSATQDDQYRNFAVGFYNPRGGHAIGRVWANPTQPDTSAASFPEGTVTFKLLFTTAPPDKVPFLAGAPEWSADIDRSQDPQQIAATKVRLLQIDIAVKDARSSCGGWVFGTFQYDAAVQAADPWRKIRPTSLAWGNDPQLKQSDYDAGQRPAESWINPDAPVVAYRSNPPAGVNPPKTLGWAGRANGPVDNSVSSCLSCHSTAQIPASSGIIPPANLLEPQKLKWFRNLQPGEPFDAGNASLDFSLQLGVGIQNLRDFQGFTENLGGFAAAAPVPTRFRAAAAEAAPDVDREFLFSRDPDEPVERLLNPFPVRE